MSAPRILFVNHTGALAGAERSLLDLLDGSGATIDAVAACPRGELFDRLEERGIDAREIPETTLSFRPHPVHTTRGLTQLLRVGIRIRALFHDLQASAIHANTERAGLAIALTRSRRHAPTVVHARAPFPENPLGALTARVLANRAEAIIANSAYTAEQFSRGKRERVSVVHNPIDCLRFDPGVVDRSAARRSLGIRDDRPLLAVIGYLAPIKRQDDAIRTLALVRDHHPEAQLLVVGATKFTTSAARHDNTGYAAELRRLVAGLGLEDAVHFAGECEDVRGALAATDLLLVPSQREGFGRVALEGMAMATPLIATAVGGTAEVVRDGVDGRLLEPEDPRAWADAAVRLLSNPERRRRMGLNGRERAIRDFSIESHVAGVISAYERILDADTTL